MVAVPFDSRGDRTRWVNYLVLSLFANAILINVVSIESKILPIPKASLLKIKLTSFKAAKPEPVKEVIEVQTPAPVKTKKVITKIKAEEIIVKQEIKSKLKAEPIPKKIEQIINPKKAVPLITKKEEIIPNERVANETKSKKYPLRTAALASNKKAIEGPTAEIKEATYRKQTPPSYPRRALELGQQGNIVLHALIKPDGFPAELKIIDSSGHSLLDKAALAAVRKWEFEPTSKNGVIIASWVRVPIEFVIQ